MQRLSRAFSTRTASSLLSDTNIASVLAKHQLTPTTPLTSTTPTALIAVLTAFRQVCEQPLPSDAFLRVNTAVDLANYYERALAPKGVPKHLSELHLKLVDNPLPCFDATPDAVANSVNSVLPENLSLDPKTFEERPIAVMSTGSRPLNVPKFNRRILLEQRRAKRASRIERRRSLLADANQ